MALVIKMYSHCGDGDELNHIEGINHDTLCGWTDAGDFSEPFIGEVTCERCRQEAYNVFQVCKKSEVKT